VLSDYLTSGFLENQNASYQFGNIVRPCPDFYIDSNASRQIAIVPIHIAHDYGSVNMTITVDLDSGKVISRYIDERFPDITYGQQMNAIKVALDDVNVQKWMKDAMVINEGANTSNYHDGYVVDAVHMSGFADYGYTDSFGFYVDVPLRIDSDIPQIVKYLIVTVNLADNSTAIRKEYLGEGLMGSVITVTIPPGQSFYRQYYSPFSSLTLSDRMPLDDTNYLSVDQQPDDIYLYPYVVDQENLFRLKNGSSFSELGSARYNMRGNQWFVYIPRFADCYLVLKNEDNKRAVNVTLPYRPF
jgi:hypothetical protein